MILSRLRLRCHAFACLVVVFGIQCSPQTLGQSPAAVQQPAGFLTAAVSPTLEIEVLDPNRDPSGNPAISIASRPDGLLDVNIAPSIIVHRYYYTGDRSFRGPVLPGGPSIVVANHPRTGERCYVEVQMLPGSPHVHYTADRIEYDFGNRAILLDFPRTGAPKLSVRNGRPLTEKISGVLQLERVKAVAAKTGTMAKAVAKKTHLAIKGAGEAFGGMTRPITLPMQNLAMMIPGAAAMTDPALEAQVLEAQATRRADLEAFQVRTLDSPDISIPRR